MIHHLLSAIDAYDEDFIDEISIGTAQLKLVKACTRCTITTTDQKSAEVGAEPLLTLARYRMNAALGGVTFGMNTIVLDGVGAQIELPRNRVVQHEILNRDRRSKATAQPFGEQKTTWLGGLP